MTMSTEAVNRIIKEVEALTPQERRDLIDRLAHEEQNSEKPVVRKPGTLKGTVKYMAPDFDESLFPGVSTEEETSPRSESLRHWLNKARKTRALLSAHR